MVAKTKLHLVPGKCCICGSRDGVEIGKGKDYEYFTSPDTFSAMRCPSCSLVYLNPRPSISEFEKIYPPNYHAFDFSKRKFGLVYKVRSFVEARRTLRRCRNLPDNARILDVGCGDGFHLSLLRKYGKKSWMLEGIDLDKRAIKAACQAGLKAHLGNVEDADLPRGQYDLILMIQTIEHVEKPDAVLGKIYELLREGGKLVIVTDNTDSVDFKFFKRAHWGGYHFPRHWNLFNRISLTKLSEKTGFQTEDLTTIVSPVNWVYSIRNSLVDRKKPNWLINRFSLKSTGSLFVFTGIDFVMQLFGKGGLLQATLRKPPKKGSEQI